MKLFGHHEQQRQLDERKVILESTYKALTEESHQETFEARLTALNYTATNMPINSVKTVRNLMRVRDGSVLRRIEEANGHEQIEGILGRRRERKKERMNERKKERKSKVLCSSRWMMEHTKKFCEKEGTGLTCSAEYLGDRCQSH